MKPEAQRIAIAEACPEVIGLSSSGAWMWKDYQGDWRACHNNDPLNDLNAMHEAEETLTGVQQDAFCNLLGWPADNVSHAAWKATHATAAQRAEAFLRTIGKWEET